MSFPKWLLPVSLFLGESQLPPASPGGSLRSASESDSGSFQTTASALGLGAWEILCVPFKCGVFVSYRPLALPNISPTGFQSQMFWRLVFLMQDPWVGDPNVGLGHIAPWKGPLWLCYSSCLWVTDPGVWVLTVPHYWHFCSSHCGSFFMSLVVENPFC